MTQCASVSSPGQGREDGVFGLPMIRTASTRTISARKPSTCCATSVMRRSKGPFAFEHPPVTERCTICHEPHGTVAKDLLRKPVTFLCLQCHAGHAMSSTGAGTGSNHGDIIMAARPWATPKLGHRRGFAEGP